MRKRQTFLLTILTPENEADSFCGRIKVISSGKTCNFTNLEELYTLIASETGEEGLQQINGQGCSLISTQKPATQA